MENAQKAASAEQWDATPTDRQLQQGRSGLPPPLAAVGTQSPMSRQNGSGGSPPFAATVARFAMLNGSSPPPPPPPYPPPPPGNAPPTSSSASPPGMSAAAWTFGIQRRDRKIWTSIRERLEADATLAELTSVELEEMLRQLMAIALPNTRIRSEVQMPI